MFFSSPPGFQRPGQKPRVADGHDRAARVLVWSHQTKRLRIFNHCHTQTMSPLFHTFYLFLLFLKWTNALFYTLSLWLMCHEWKRKVVRIKISVFTRSQHIAWQKHVSKIVSLCNDMPKNNKQPGWLKVVKSVCVLYKAMKRTRLGF